MYVWKKDGSLRLCVEFFVSSMGGQYLRVTHFLASRKVSRISGVINGSHHWTKEKLITRDLLVPTVNM